MCFHKSSNYTKEDLDVYYQSLQKQYGALADEEWEKQWDSEAHFHETGFDFQNSPVITKDGYGYLTWGLIPWFTKSMDEAISKRATTLNCISEEMFEKNSFRDAVKEGRRCLVPATGFFEPHWNDKKGKDKSAYYIHLKEQKIFSFAGLWSTWKDKSDGDKEYHTYTILTTKANPKMEEWHNSKKIKGEEPRMPVIIPREYEADWLNPNLTREDVLALCQPYDGDKMEGYLVNKAVVNTKVNTNFPEILNRVESGLLF